MPIPVQDLQTTPNQPKNDVQPNTPAQAPTTSTVAPTSQAPVTPTPVQEDLVSRASSITLDEAASKVNSDQGDIIADAGFDRNRWNEMLSKLPPDQKTQLEAAYKSLQSGADKKFQKAAEMLRQVQQTQEQPWTLDRIQKLTQDPNFVQAASQYSQLNQGNQPPTNSGLNDEEWSNLSDVEKQKFHQLTQNQQVLQGQLEHILLNQEDDKLKTRYRNYDPTQVRTLRQQLIGGQVQATSEHLWKVLDYESAIQRAYKLGMQDRQLEIGEKQNASSVGGNGMNITPSGDKPTKQPNENPIDFFKRLAAHNKQALANAQGQRQ